MRRRKRRIKSINDLHSYNTDYNLEEEEEEEEAGEQTIEKEKAREIENKS